MTTITEKQKCIAEQMLYDLQIIDIETKECEWVVSKSLGIINSPHIKIILRPMSDITKEITHKGYNENKPFIPLVELAKIAYHESTTREIDFINGSFVGSRKRMLCRDGDNNGYAVCDVPKQQLLFELLYQWHFDTRSLIYKKKAISTDEINPYKV